MLIKLLPKLGAEEILMFWPFSALWLELWGLLP